MKEKAEKEELKLVWESFAQRINGAFNSKYNHLAYADRFKAEIKYTFLDEDIEFVCRQHRVFNHGKNEVKTEVSVLMTGWNGIHFRLVPKNWRTQIAYLFKPSRYKSANPSIQNNFMVSANNSIFTESLFSQPKFVDHLIQLKNIDISINNSGKNQCKVALLIYDWVLEHEQLYAIKFIVEHLVSELKQS